MQSRVAKGISGTVSHGLRCATGEQTGTACLILALRSRELGKKASSYTHSACWTRVADIMLTLRAFQTEVTSQVDLSNKTREFKT